MKDLPTAWPLKKLIGPSFIILGMGLGSGELILWPYLASNFGLGMAWMAVAGITLQFFLNMEIERYSLVTGESVFAGWARKWGKFAPAWFILSSLLPWVWPGIAASAGVVLAAFVGVSYSKWWGMGLLLAVGIIYNLGRVVYKVQERVQKAIIFVGVPLVVGVTIWIARWTDWTALGAGLGNVGRLPAGIPVATLLAAMVYSGAGGNLNLAQSLYIREKGYGMGKYTRRLTNVFTKFRGDSGEEGEMFEQTQENIARYRLWWRRINWEHGIVFWLTGLTTILILMLLAYITVHGHLEVGTSINFVLLEAKSLGRLGGLFLVAVGVMLFGTQFAVYGSNARIAAENLVLVNSSWFRVQSIPKYFYGFLWLQIAVGMAVFAAGFTEPLTLVVLGAVLNAGAMAVYSGLILGLNLGLPVALRPVWWRVGLVGLAGLIYGGFMVFTVYNYFANYA